ncbi:Protein of unknown function [Tistlia consotensis]|uniref:DUF3445 domain-containing protein n=1 Tax=Tistlia consotensis USBA 355 TaxID=560819 RepID=A0A1Y6CAD9_9PROT|nr:DUF3445 domain-containing protein [Tistlia consotensis]SMF45421.1 Protein of unknown function [Tistlia consotensis USBA 355]SNR79910.1 Protein of unknown function [Tistlia consotensis]
MTIPPYLPFTDGPWRMTMGLMAMKPRDWIEIDEEYDFYVAEKRRLLSERRAAIFAARPGSEAACRELQDNLAGFLAERFPERFALEGRTLTRLADGTAWDLDDGPEKGGEHPLARAGLWVQEDFCLLQSAGEDEPYLLTAATLSFPTRWKLAEKVGVPLLAIHDPVPGYGERLGRPVDRFFQKLSPDRPVWRANWSLIDEPTLFVPEGHGRKDRDPAITAENAGERVWLRVERQTLRRLPESGAVVFGIRVYRHPLSSLAEAPEAAGQLARWLGELPEDLARYKSLPVFGEAVRSYLQKLACVAA